MKELLTNAKTKLRTLAWVKDRDVFVTEDIRMVRNFGDYPAIGLKDGGSVPKVETSDQTEWSLTVTAVCYVKLHKPEAAIMGDASTGEPGLLDMADDVIAALYNTFGGTYDTVTPVSIGESEALLDENQIIQMLPVTLRYTR